MIDSPARLSLAAAVICLAVTTPLSALGAAAPWFDDYYAVRIPVEISATEAGRQVVEIDPSAVTKWINENAEFPFTVQAFAYDNIRLVEADSDGRELPGKFYYRQGAELLANGGFQDVDEKGRPVGWVLAKQEGYQVLTEAGDTNRVLDVQGADRNACLQIIPTDDHSWYRLSYRSKGKTTPIPEIVAKGVGGWVPVDRSVFDPAINFKRWSARSCFFYTDDKSEWEVDTLSLRIERFSGQVDDVSLRPCRMVFVADITKPGTQRYTLYYSPCEGPLPSPPAAEIKALPKLTATVTRTGTAEWLDDALSRTVSTTEAGALWWAPTTHKLKTDAPIPAATIQTVHIACARNEAEAVQLAFRATKQVRIESVSAALTGPAGHKLPVTAFDIRRGHYLPIRTPSTYMNGGRVVKASRFAFTGKLPDPLTPFAPLVRNVDDPPLPIWVDITVPKDAAAGRYTGAITLTTDAGEIIAPLHLDVWDFALPDQPTCRTAFGISQYANTFLFPFHKVETREDKYALSHAYIAAGLRYKISPKGPAGSYHWGSETPANWSKTETVIRAYEQELPWAMDKLHATTLLAAHWAGPSFDKKETEENGIKEAVRLESIATLLDERGWLDRAFVWIDEPRPPAYPMMRKWIAHLREQPHAKKLKLFPLVYNGEAYEGLGDMVDMMAFWDGEYPHSTFSQQQAQRSALPFEPWGYYTRNCVLWIDTPGINNRFWAPKMWAMGGRGIAIWCILQWWDRPNSPHTFGNPWVDPMVTWGNGALSYFYPPNPMGKELPEKDMTIVPSLRLLLTRDGIEDFEYGEILTTLATAARQQGLSTTKADAALAALRRPFESTVHWTLSQTYWQNARRDAAQAIVATKQALRKAAPNTRR